MRPLIRPHHLMRRVRAMPLAATVVTMLCGASSAGAQWTIVYDRAYLPASHNWVFRDKYPQADRLFNAFDYGHAILSETLWGEPNSSVLRLEHDAFTILTKRLLVSPPRLPLAEAAIAPNFVRLAPEVEAMFEWAHVLHRQVYDVLADERLDASEKDAAIKRVYAWYRARTDLAFSGRPKTMALMQEQPYSLAFRQKYPKFNGLIWSYHWLQMGLYEPLVTERTPEGKQAGITAALARFRQLIDSAPFRMPAVMPMTAAIAPQFAAKYPELAIVFDNLHSLHDVVSDILANPNVPRDQKRSTMLRAAAAYRDDTTEVMTVAGWRRMSLAMGATNMGGKASGIINAPPIPTLERGAVMKHDKDGNAIGEHAGHNMAPADSGKPVPKAVDHAAHAGAADTVKAAVAPAAAPALVAAIDHATMDHSKMNMAATPSAKPAAVDTGFAGVQKRGAAVMGVDQFTSQHVFEELPDGGRIILVRDPKDSVGTAQIRAHLREIAGQFARGDFTNPMLVHDLVVPGTTVMAAKRSRIRYSMRERAGGGEVRITTADAAARKAVRDFLAFQRSDHHAPAHEPE